MKHTYVSSSKSVSSLDAAENWRGKFQEEILHSVQDRHEETFFGGWGGGKM